MNPLKKLSKYQLILASKSPRRRQLLTELGVDFEVKTMDVDESFPSDMPVDDIAAFLAEKKSLAFVSQLRENQLVITADTIVAQNNLVLNKPENEKHAREMLQTLSGKKHEVITGVCLLTKDRKEIFSAKTSVWFNDLTNTEIDYYIEKYKPFDKAGAYGIQEWIGFIGISRIDGSYFNVMGLPVQQLYSRLLTF